MTFKSLLKDTLKTIQKDWHLYVGLVLLLSFIPTIVLITVYIANHGFTFQEPLTSTEGATVVVSVFITILLTVSILDVIRKRHSTVRTAVRGGTKFFWPATGLTLLTFVLLILLYALFIIPGIIFTIYWMFAYYALIFEKKSVWGSLKRSKKIVEGNWWRVFGYSVLITVAVTLLNLVLLLLIAAFVYVTKAYLSPAITLVLLIFFDTAFDAISLLFFVIFFERMYRELKSKKPVHKLGK